MTTTAYKMEVWDMMQYFFEKFNDHMMHASIKFDKKLDLNVLKKSVADTLNIIPILKCKFKTNLIRGGWKEVENIDIDKIVTICDLINNSDVEEFLTTVIREKEEVQIKIRIFRTKDCDTLAIIINHMCFDGKCFKDYLNLLSTIYNNYMANENYKCDIKVCPNRSFDTLFKTFSKEEKKMLAKRKTQGKPNSEKVGFPFEANSEKSVYAKINKIKLDSEDFKAIKAYGKTINATVNDIIIASYIRAINEIVSTDKSIDIDCIADLRRHLKESNSLGYTNFVSKIICDIGADIGANLLDTIKKVHICMDKAKDDYPGMDGLTMLMTGYKLLPLPLARIAVSLKYSNPLNAISNIGILDDKSINFNGLFINDMYLTGSIKHNPYIQLALTTFRESVTFTIAIYGTDNDHKLADKLLNILKNNLISLK